VTDRVLDSLVEAGFSCSALEIDEARGLRERVRDAFPDARGDYPTWTACARRECRARTSSKAAYEYESLGAGPWFVLQERARASALRIDGPTALPFRCLATSDCEVVPADLSWLFVASHEDAGPFLIRRGPGHGPER
jgi:hypothetical protein